MEDNYKAKQATLRSDQLIDPTQERRLLQLKDDIEGNMKLVNTNFKDLTKIIADIKSYTVDSYGDQENKLKKQEDTKLERDLTQLYNTITTNQDMYGKALKKYMDIK